MSEGLPDLVSHVRLDTTGVATGVAKTKAELGGLGGSTKALEGQFKGILSSITSLGPGTSALSGHFSQFASAGKSALSGVSTEAGGLKAALPAVGVGVAAVGAAFVAFGVESLGKFISVAGEVNKLKTTLGSTAEDASKLRNVAIGLGVDTDTMGKAFFKLGPILEKANGDLAGIHVEIAKNSDGTTNFIGTIDNMRKAYQSIHDPIQKAQFLQEAFKKTGLELRPILSANAELFNKLANNGPIIHQSDIDQARALAIAQRELKQKVEEVQISVARNLIPVLNKLGDSLTADGHKTRSYGQVIDLLIPSHHKAAGSAAAFAQAQDQAAAALEETKKQADAAAKALDKLSTAQESALDKGLGLEHAQIAVERATSASAKAHKDAEKAVQEFGRASEEADTAVNAAIDSDLSLKDAVIAAAKATRDKKVADDEANGATDSATDKVHLLVGALREQASHLAPGSELRANIEAYADQLNNGIPKAVNTDVTANTAEAEAAVARLKAAITSLNADVTFQNSYNNLTGAGNKNYAAANPAAVDAPAASDPTQNDEGRATGGSVYAGRRYTVGEGGKAETLELFPGGGGYVYPNVLPGPATGRASGGYVSAPSIAGSAPTSSAGSSSASGDITITPAPVILNIDGREFARGTVQFTAQELRGLGRGRGI